jgi:hypothetical protein
MKYRIAGWAGAGFLVAGCWALYFTGADKGNLIEPTVYLFAYLTCPITLLRFYPVSLYSVLLANAATYALVGLIVETLRRQPRHAN